jgi:hypothetical protein
MRSEIDADVQTLPFQNDLQEFKTLNPLRLRTMLETIHNAKQQMHKILAKRSINPAFPILLPLLLNQNARGKHRKAISPDLNTAALNRTSMHP